MTRGHIGMGALALLLLAPVGAIAKSKPATGEDTMNTSSAAARLDKAPGKPALSLGAFELEDQGYLAEEHFLSGDGAAYVLQGTAGQDGRWNARPAGARPFVTRIVVVRPRDASRFSGKAVIEWLNVSAGGDSPPGWVTMHREIIRAGHGYVGVTTQKVAIDGGSSLGLGARPLKVSDPQRYGRLDHPGDTYAFDIFAQAGQTIRRVAKALFGAPLQHGIAFGASQSAFFLTTFVNAIAPLHRPFDGYLIQARFGGAAPLANPDIFAPTVHADVRFRSDLGEPVLVVESESDVVGVGIGQGGYAAARQPDGPQLTIWEIAGAAHADLSIFAVGDVDTNELSMKRRVSAWRPRKNLLGQVLDIPVNSAPQQYYMMNAALRRLVERLDHGKQPPSAAPLTISSAPATPAGLERDAVGIAYGGVRSPWVDAPLMAHSGVPNPAEPMGFLIGQSRPFDRATIERLYPGGRADHLARFTGALDHAIAAGFILAENRSEIVSLAEASWSWATETEREKEVP